MPAATVTVFDLSYPLLVPVPRGRAGPSCHGNKREMLSLEAVDSAAVPGNHSALLSALPFHLPTHNKNSWPGVPVTLTLAVLLWSFTHTPLPQTGFLSHLALPTLKSVPCLRMDAPPLWGLTLPDCPTPVPRHSVLPSTSVFSSKTRTWSGERVKYEGGGSCSTHSADRHTLCLTLLLRYFLQSSVKRRCPFCPLAGVCCADGSEAHRFSSALSPEAPCFPGAPRLLRTLTFIFVLDQARSA